MKKYFLFSFFAFLFFANSSYAQQPQNEFSVGCGFITSQDIFEIEQSMLESIITLGITKSKLTSESGVIGIQYKHFVGNFDFSSTFGYQEFKKKYYIAGDLVGKTSLEWYTFLAQANYSYIRSNMFQLYSGLGFGYSLYEENGKLDLQSNNDYKYEHGESIFSYQLNLLGLRIGKRLGLNLEFGFGFKGVMNAALSYQF